MNRFVPSTARFVTTQPGITSWHCFAAGPHYDPERLAFGPLVGVDEHLIEPGAAFDWHAHRGVRIVSVVRAGALRHEDSDGRVLEVRPGEEMLAQAAGAGIRHREGNASESEPLRFVQVTLLDDAERDVSIVRGSVTADGYAVALGRGEAQVRRPAFVLVLDGPAAGDSFRVLDGEVVESAGELLVVALLNVPEPGGVTAR